MSSYSFLTELKKKIVLGVCTYALTNKEEGYRMICLVMSEEESH